MGATAIGFTRAAISPAGSGALLPARITLPAGATGRTSGARPSTGAVATAIAGSVTRVVCTGRVVRIAAPGTAVIALGTRALT